MPNLFWWLCKLIKHFSFNFVNTLCYIIQALAVFFWPLYHIIQFVVVLPQVACSCYLGRLARDFFSGFQPLSISIILKYMKFNFFSIAMLSSFAEAFRVVRCTLMGCIREIQEFYSLSIKVWKE